MIGCNSFVKYNSDKHRRRSIRLKGYDYASPGAYFITLCAYQRRCLFGNINDGRMYLNDFGSIVAEEWARSSLMRQEIELDEWVVMPNHMHGIVFIRSLDNPTSTVGAQGLAPLQPTSNRVQPSGIACRKPRSLSSFIAGFKTATTKRINSLRNLSGTSVWQRNYYDHIIRNEIAMANIRNYIRTNPQKWQMDQIHPENPSRW